jgi:hypothetical protein
MPTLDLTGRKTQEELAQLPHPTNDGLKDLFQNIDTVVIKDGGVYQGKAMRNEVLFTISQPEAIKTLESFLEIDEMNTGFYCLCLGTYAIELYDASTLRATIGFHHNVSIRYDKWNGDAALVKNQELLHFLAGLGFTQPLNEFTEEATRHKKDMAAENEWFHLAPKCFAKYRQQMSDFDNSYFPSLLKDLQDEEPGKDQQITALLQTFGRSKNLWTAYPMYEEVPLKILQTFTLAEIINAYINSDRNYKTRRGLGRMLCAFDYKKTRKRHLKSMPQSVIDDIYKCFVAINDETGIARITKLNKAKNRE